MLPCNANKSQTVRIALGYAPQHGIHAQLMLLHMARWFSVLRIKRLSLQNWGYTQLHVALCSPARPANEPSGVQLTNRIEPFQLDLPEQMVSQRSWPEPDGPLRPGAWSSQPGPLVLYQSRTWPLGVNPALWFEPQHSRGAQNMLFSPVWSLLESSRQTAFNREYA